MLELPEPAARDAGRSLPPCGVELAASAAPAGAAPPTGVPELPAAATAGGTPWDERDRVGILTALVDTTRMVLTRPSEFFRALPVTGGIGAPLLYAVIVGWLGVVAASLYQAIFRSIVGSSLAAFG